MADVVQSVFYPAPGRHLLAFNKPYGVLCQFSDTEGRATLKDFLNIPNVYPAGRLDRDSEGLVILTDDGSLQARIAHPRYKLEKVYWVQVEGEINDSALDVLRRGVLLKDGLTAPAKVSRMDEPDLWPRQPPVRFRKYIPTSWLEIRLREGRNRQVRRMTTAVGYPTLRLVRMQVGSMVLGTLSLGQYQYIDRI